MNPRHISASQLSVAKRLYAAGASTHTLSRHLGLGQETVRLNLMRAGVAIRSAADGQRAAAARRREMAQRSAQAAGEHT